MNKLHPLFENNQAWAKSVEEKDPDFFERLSKQQRPRYLWIGCSDSRVPANQITGLDPGEVFVHRNVANIVVHTDLNCLSSLQFAVDYLKVTDIIVCGHYGCGGIAAAASNAELGLIDNWLRHIKDIYYAHKDELEAIEDQSKRTDRLCELNVIQQVLNLSHTPIVQNAWKNSQELNIHGWIYGLKDGLLKDLKTEITNAKKMYPIFKLNGNV